MAAAPAPAPSPLCGGVGLVTSSQRQPHWFAPPVRPAPSPPAALPTAQRTTASLDHQCKEPQAGSRWVVGEHWGLTELLRWLPATAMQSVLAPDSRSDDEPDEQPHRKRQRSKEGLALPSPPLVVGLAANADTGQVAISNGGQAGEGCGGSKASPSGRRVCPALARQH